MKVFFSGIGGIGMSALARYYKASGYDVYGSDQAESVLTKDLASEGIRIAYQQCTHNIDRDTDLFIFSEAIAEDHPERVSARELGVTSKSYFAAIGGISRAIPTVAVAGTHGKSTTTAMLGLMLEEVCEPLVIVGTKVFEWERKNMRLPKGKSDIFVVEACEYRASFLHLQPQVIVITNCEPDHLDYYGTAEQYYQTFLDFVAQLPDDGKLVADFSDPTIEQLFSDVPQQKINVADFYDHLPALKVIGQHNKQNAATALAASSIILEGLEQPLRRAREFRTDGFQKMLHKLSEFRGTWRRMEYKGVFQEADVYDDYGHHPTEIAATVRALREEFPDRKILLVFQPHQFSRTRDFFDQFASCLALADQVLVPNIYSVRDSKADCQATSAQALVDGINAAGCQAEHTQDVAKTVAVLQSTVTAEHIVMTMGAGDVWEVSEQLIHQTSKV